MKNILVAGGGAAGISAALSAADKGYKVTLVESLNRLGGRLGSFHDKKAGQTFDFGEHLILGGYTHTRELLKRMNSPDSVYIQPRLSIPFYRPGEKVHRFTLLNVPSPFDFLHGVAYNKLFTIKERIQLARQLRRLLSAKDLSGITSSAWLKDSPLKLIELFWNPVIISVMNCTAEEADMNLVLTAFKKGFLQKGGLGFFTQSQSQIFNDNAKNALESSGITILLNAKIVELNHRDGSVSSITITGGDKIEAAGFIFTMPPDYLSKIEGCGEDTLGFDGNSFEYSDICNVHLVFEREIFTDDFGCLLKVLPQWFFRRRWNYGNSPGIGYSLTISAADKLIPPGSNIIETCLDDLRKCGADFENNRLIYSKTVLSKKATVKISPEFTQNRPSHQTNLKNLFIAGDWTDTGLPATIESAVLSGFEAVDILNFNYCRSD